MSEWISVKDELPSKNQHVIAYFVGCITGKTVVFQVRHCGGGEFRTSDDNSEISYDYNITHWMPLPSPPEMQSSSEVTP